MKYMKNKCRYANGYLMDDLRANMRFCIFRFYSLDMAACPPWSPSNESARENGQALNGGLFDNPPLPKDLKSKVSYGMMEFKGERAWIQCHNLMCSNVIAGNWWRKILS